MYPNCTIIIISSLRPTHVRPKLCAIGLTRLLKMRINLCPKRNKSLLGSSHCLHHGSSTGMRVSDVDLRPVDCPRSGSPHRQWDDAGEARQPHFGCLPIPAPATANHPSVSHHGRCSCSGTRTHTHAYQLLQRAP